ncbi:MAG: ribosomal protein S18-alanine N-acetyltransferase [Pelotomaculum sp.]|nr:ribosomal protein S18-alanine N-acetyltransferase [Pelotomaculum sp.]
MRLEHLDQVVEIENFSFPSPWSRSAFAYEILQNRFACYLVAVAGGTVVGYGGMWLILDEAHITNVAVHPEYRKNNIGRTLMLEMMRRAALMGAVRMTLEVRPSNAAARRLYASLGFEVKGIRRRYYTDTNEDAIIMWKEDLTGCENRA